MHVTGIRSILCLFDGDAAQVKALDLALALSVRHNAFVHTLQVTEPIDPYLELNAAQEASVLQTQSHIAEQVTRMVRNRAETFGKNLWRGRLAAREFYENGVGFEAVIGFAEKVFPRVARTNDLVICCKTRVKKEATPDAFMSILLRSGRPVLLVPSQNSIPLSGELFDADVAVAWDRSVQATRTLHNLVPFLHQDCRLHILSVAEHNKKIDVRDDPAVMYWLRRHGFVPSVHHMEQGDKPVGDLLLSKAQEIGAGLLAAGAYGQNAIVEKLIGGTTIDLYRQAQIPLFLTH